MESSDVNINYQPRSYRSGISAEGLVSFEVRVLETDLHISASKDMRVMAEDSVRRYRAEIEGYICCDPVFGSTFSPHQVSSEAPAIVRAMAEAAIKADVGPMAAVAGAIAEYVGKDLLSEAEEVIVENGGDIFISSQKTRRIGIFAGDSSFSQRLSVVIRSEQTPVGVCASSGTIGHSVSFGRADAAVIVSIDTAFADAMATAVGNRVRTEDDIDTTLVEAQKVSGVDGVVIIKGDKIGLWGDITVEPISKKG